MMDFDDFKKLAALIEAAGVSADNAGDYAAWIGDTPEITPEGMVVVRDEDGAEVDRIPAAALGFDA